MQTIWLSVNFDFLNSHLQRNGSLYFQLVHRLGVFTEARPHREKILSAGPLGPEIYPCLQMLITLSMLSLLI